DRLEALRGAVETDHHGFLAAVVQRSGRAQRHLVVLGKDGVDVTVALEHVGHHVQTTGAVEVGGLLRDDLDVVVLGDTLAEALTTFTARRGTRGALKHHDPALSPISSASTCAA